MPFHQHTLPNGLQVLGEINPSALSAAVCFWVRTGARDETPEVSGVSHFLEHMVFKGTERRDAFAVNRDFSRIGADNNAFTSEESTVFHATVLPEFLPDAVDVLADILRPSLRTDDFDTEKKVILDEIARYEVQPAWATYDRARKTYFGPHPLGNSVLGSDASITALKRDQMEAYFRRRYVAPNIHVVAAGNFDWKQFVSLVEKHCGDWPKGEAGRSEVRETKGTGGLHVVEKPREKVSQEYVMLISPAPAADSPLRYAATVLATVVGDYTGSRLYWALVDPGLADEAGMGSDECQGAGAYFTSFNCSPDRAEECYAVVRQVLEEVQRDGITPEELQQAKTKIASREVRGGERTHRRLITVGRDWTYLKQYRTVDDELASWDAVSPAMVRELLDRYPLTKYTALAYGPLGKLAGTEANGQ